MASSTTIELEQKPLFNIETIDILRFFNSLVDEETKKIYLNKYLIKLICLIFLYSKTFKTRSMSIYTPEIQECFLFLLLMDDDVGTSKNELQYGKIDINKIKWHLEDMCDTQNDNIYYYNITHFIKFFLDYINFELRKFKGNIENNKTVDRNKQRHRTAVNEILNSYPIINKTKKSKKKESTERNERNNENTPNITKLNGFNETSFGYEFIDNSKSNFKSRRGEDIKSSFILKYYLTHLTHLTQFNLLIKNENKALFYDILYNFFTDDCAVDKQFLAKEDSEDETTRLKQSEDALTKAKQELKEATETLTKAKQELFIFSSNLLQKNINKLSKKELVETKYHRPSIRQSKKNSGRKLRFENNTIQTLLTTENHQQATSIREKAAKQALNRTASSA